MADYPQDDCDRFVLVLIDGDSMPVRSIWNHIYHEHIKLCRKIFMTDIISSLMRSYREVRKAGRTLASIFAQPYWSITRTAQDITPTTESLFVFTPMFTA